MYAIVKNDKGEIISTQEVDTVLSQVVNGFEKNLDGNFYKVLGDPRCISDQIAAVEKDRQEQEKKRLSLIPPKTKVLYITGPFSIQEFAQKMKWRMMSCRQTVDTYDKCRVGHITNLPDIIKQISSFKRIDIHSKYEILRFWVKDDKKEYADFLLYIGKKQNYA